MTRLSERSCSACQAGAPSLSADAISSGLAELPGWELIQIEGINQLRRVYKFRNFVKALDFAQQVGVLAEEYGHHPALLVEWGRLEVRWWTHKIKGLHENDLIMAAKTELAFARLPE